MPAFEPERYEDRRAAGLELAALLSHYLARPDVIVLGLPRGGVPVAVEVARALRVALDVFVVRKLGLPGHPELAMGAIAAGGVRVLNAGVIADNRISDAALAEVEAKQQTELERRERVYREGRPPLDVRGRTVLLVDDGLATGATMRVAIQAIRVLAPARVVMAVPVGGKETCREFQGLADEVVCARSPEDLVAVGLWYRNFAQTTDDEIHDLLQNET